LTQNLKENPQNGFFAKSQKLAQKAKNVLFFIAQMSSFHENGQKSKKTKNPRTGF
jgi:hypothetical protein